MFSPFIYFLSERNSFPILKKCALIGEKKVIVSNLILIGGCFVCRELMDTLFSLIILINVRVRVSCIRISAPGECCFYGFPLLKDHCAIEKISDLLLQFEAYRRRLSIRLAANSGIGNLWKWRMILTMVYKTIRVSGRPRMM